MHKHLSRGLGVMLAVMILAVGCAPNPNPNPEPEKPVLVGLADYHTHQFGYLGFRGQETLNWVISHSEDPGSECWFTFPYEDSFKIKDLVKRGIFEIDHKQANTHYGGTIVPQCYPTVRNLASQRMDTDNLQRAWEYGLRLIVVFAVNSEFLCDVAELHGPEPCMSDRAAIELQIQAAKDLEARIDAEYGGPGQGWYRIVYTPQQAREVISQGKLAVVLGVEASNAFGGCRFVPSGSVDPVNDGDPPETTWELLCGYPEPVGSLQTQEGLALFEHYWQLGARHFFPIHNMNGTAGGTALSIPLLHADDNPSRVAQGSEEAVPVGGHRQLPRTPERSKNM